MAMSVFTSTLPPLASNLVAVAALATLPGRGDQVLERAGDFWIALAELLQVVKERGADELMAIAKTFAAGCQVRFGNALAAPSP